MSLSESNLTSTVGQIVSFKCVIVSLKIIRLLVSTVPCTAPWLLPTTGKKSKYTSRPKSSDTFASKCREIAFFETIWENLEY